MSGESALFVAAVALFTAVAAVVDLRTRKVPNLLTVPAFLAAVTYHMAFDGLNGLATAAGGFALGFGPLFVLWIVGGGGGGDVKLMGALGAWLGPRYTLYVLALSTGFVALASAAVFLWSVATRGLHAARNAKDGSRNTKSQNGRRPRRRLMAFGLPVAVATWLVLAVQLLKGPAETSAIGQTQAPGTRETSVERAAAGDL